MADGDGDWLWYLYGVQRATAPVPAVDGVDGRPVTAVIHDSLAALASRVPAGRFGEQTDDDPAADLQWLGRQAIAHEAVLAEAFAAGPVLPLRFGAVYRTRDGIVDFLVGNRAPLLNELHRLASHSEWSVKVVADRRAVERWLGEADEMVTTGDGADPSVGHAYFARRRRQLRAAQEFDRVCADVAAEVHQHLAGIAAHALTARPQDPTLSGLDGDMVLNGIYLLHADAAARFHDAIAALQTTYAPKGFTLLPTGPWPPHSFVDVSGYQSAEGRVP